MKEKTKISLLNGIMIIGLILVSVSVLSIFSEVSGAFRFCHSVDGDFGVRLASPNYLCDGKYIFKYQDGWDFERLPNEIEWKDYE